MSIEDSQYSFLPFIKLLSSTKQQALLARIKNKFKLSENIVKGEQDIPESLIADIFLYGESENEIGLAFNYGLISESGSFGLLDYYLASCDDLETAIKQLIYFFSLISEANGNPKIFINAHQQLEFSLTTESIVVPAQRIIIEQIFASVIALITRLNNQRWPYKIHFPQQSFSKSVYDNLTSKGIDVDFNSKCYRLILNSKQHQSLLRFKNQNALALIKPELEQLLLDKKQKESIVVEILKLFSSEKNIALINQNAISEKLNVSESSLKRRLAEVGSNFSNILSRFKREKAIELLNKQTSSMDETAKTLGYSDRSSFERAFKQWTNTTPSQYIQQISLAELHLENIKATDIDSLPTSPKICQQVLELTQSDDFDIPQLTSLIQTDPILTGKLMSIANSAYYGGNNIADINQAIIQVLGVDVVKNMVFSLMCCSQLKIKNCPEFSLQSFWFQSLFTAEAIKLVSHHEVIKSNISASEIYLAALLHKIGDYVLVFLKPKIMSRYLGLDHHSNEFSHIKKYFIEERKLQEKIFGLSTESTGALVLTHWGLPKTVCDLIKEMNTEFSQQSKISKVLTLISFFSQHLLFNLEDTDIPNEFLQELSEVLAVDQSILNRSLIKVVNRIESIDAISREISRAS